MYIIYIYQTFLIYYMLLRILIMCFFLLEPFVVAKLCRTIKHTHSNGCYNCCLRALNFESLSWFQRLHATNSTAGRCRKPLVSSNTHRFHVWYMIYVPLFTYIWLILIVNLWVSMYIYIYVYKDHTWILWEKLTNFLFSPVVVMSTKPPKKQLPTAESLRKKSGLVYDYHLETHTIIYHPCMVYLPSIWLICMVFM